MTPGPAPALGDRQVAARRAVAVGELDHLTHGRRRLRHDHRMSRRDLIKMTPDEVDAFLHGRRTMNLATYNHDGSIHLVAMWYGFLADGTIGFETFARSQKVQNLRRDPRVTALVEAGDQYENLQGVELVGTMESPTTTTPSLTIATRVLERYHPEVGEADRLAAAEMVINKRVAMLLRPERPSAGTTTKLRDGYWALRRGTSRGCSGLRSSGATGHPGCAPPRPPRRGHRGRPPGRRGRGAPRRGPRPTARRGRRVPPTQAS